MNWEDWIYRPPIDPYPGAVLALDGIDRHKSNDPAMQGNCSRDGGSTMTYLNKQEFQAWAYDDLLANTTRGLLAEYIVAKEVGALTAKRVEWDQYDLKIDGIGVEVKSSAYVQSWEQTGPSVISFDIGPRTGWDAGTNTYAASPGRSADVYVFCLLEEKDRERVDPLDVEQWTFYVLATSVLNREVPVQKTIRLEPLIDLGAQRCTYEELKAAIHEAAAVNRGA